METVGRFAPSPSGRMHLGNVFAALLAWLSVRSQDGKMLLRMEDLDTQRCKAEYAALLRDDLRWLGLDWDEETPMQSTRTAAYEAALDTLSNQGLLYPCYCTRAQLHRIDAPHLADGTYIYPGTCRNLTDIPKNRTPAWRLQVPDRIFSFHDRCQGFYSQNLKEGCGDFILRRGDGMFVYQLAVTVDDGEAGVTEVVRGMDLLSSSPRQMYLQELLGYCHPTYAHVPLLMSADGRRLSKRDRDMDLGYLRANTTPQAVVGYLAFAAGITDTPKPCEAKELIAHFSWDKVRRDPVVPNISL